MPQSATRYRAQAPQLHLLCSGFRCKICRLKNVCRSDPSPRDKRQYILSCLPQNQGIYLLLGDATGTLLSTCRASHQLSGFRCISGLLQLPNTRGSCNNWSFVPSSSPQLCGNAGLFQYLCGFENQTHTGQTRGKHRARTVGLYLTQLCTLWSGMYGVTVLRTKTP